VATGFPYKGNRVIPRLQTLDSGMIVACFTIESNDGAVVRYAREMPTNEFASEDDAIATSSIFPVTGSIRIRY